MRHTKIRFLKFQNSKGILKQILFLLLIIVLLSSCSKSNYDSGEVIIGDVSVKVEIADTLEKRTLGLMNREELGEFDGMFFVFDEEQEMSFWMKNTLISLDIIFIDSNYEIVKIHTAEPCISDLCKTYSSDALAQYVLEVNAGFSEKYGIVESMKISII